MRSGAGCGCLSLVDEIYCASLGTTIPQGEPPSRIVYMPAGLNKLVATNPTTGKSRRVQVEVTRELAEVFQAQLAERLARNVRPFIGFDHAKGPAAALPKAFAWDDEMGLMLELEWTASGAEAVTGRDYSYFSPTWRQGAKATRPSGLPLYGEIGSLTNDPAFENIQRLVAARHQSTMTDTEIETLQAEAARLTAERDTAQTQVTTLTSERDAALAERDALRAERDALLAERDALRAERDSLRQAEADTLAANAARDGRIAEGERPRWAEALVRDPAARELLAALPVRSGASQEPIHQAARAPASDDVLATYQAMKPGKEKDEYLRANGAAILAAERAAR